MTLDEFEKEMMGEVVEFFENWRKENKKDPDMFPMEMDQGNWDEQFLSTLFGIFS